MVSTAEQWSADVRAGNVRAIARAITAIENREPESEELLGRLFSSTGQAYLIGVTGAPGTGKSTLVDRLAAHYRKIGQQVGIVAVDPTSPYTGGAILGDRIRMQGHAGDPGIFIRSMATRGYLGGLSRTTSDVALLLDAAGKQCVLIETVGVGQDEVDVARLAECTMVVLVPDYGDDIQNMKAGLMEVADIFVVNKSDRDGADRLEMQLHAMLELAPNHDGWKPRIVRTVATEGRGIEELAGTLAEFRASRHRQQGDFNGQSVDQWKRRLLALAGEAFEREMLAGEGEARLDQLARDVWQRKIDPYAAARTLMLKKGSQGRQ